MGAFITFKTEKGHNKLLEEKFCNNEHAMILGDKLRIREAEQPDNIIWENKDVKGIYKKFIQLKYKIIMTVVIFIVAACLVKLKNYTTQFDDLYPNLDKF